MGGHAETMHQLVDHLFRREFGRVVSRLAGVFGAHRLDMVEDAVQFAMLQALQLWPHKGAPENPQAWLMRVAGNRALDLVKGEHKVRFYEGEDETALKEYVEELPLASSADGYRCPEEVADEQLALMFVCCHPALPRPASVALTLKVVCGFGVEEIARAFLMTEGAVSQRLVRAKRLIREQRITFEVPGPSALRERLDAVLEVLYLLFTEGYAPTAGDQLIKAELCDEAIRLAELLTLNRVTAQPECEALLAMMLFQAARFESRINAAGELLLLEQQDRGRWNQSMIGRGLLHLERAARGKRLTSYHLQAEIAAIHASSNEFNLTDWKHILALYDLLMLMQPTPIVSINLAIAVSQVEGPEAGLLALKVISCDDYLERYPFLPMAEGEFHCRLGNVDAAAHCFSRALDLARTEPERRFIKAKLSSMATVRLS